MKYLFGVVFVLFFGHQALAQDSLKVSWGIKAGANFSWYNSYKSQVSKNNTNKPDYHKIYFPSKESIYIGGFVYFKTNFLQTDGFMVSAFYSGQGSLYQNPTILANELYHTHYLSTEYKAKFKFSDYIYAYLGFSVDILLKGDKNLPKQKPLDVTLSIFNFEYMFSKNLGIVFNHRLGLMNILSEESPLPFKGKLENNAIQIGFNYYIN